MKRLETAALTWRETEKEMIADGNNPEKTKAHFRAKVKLREVVDTIMQEQKSPTSAATDSGHH